MMKKAPSYETVELREFGEVLQGRRTINLYLQTRVPSGLVKEAIEAAIWAPNHHVTEPWHFYLLGRETVGRCVDLVRDIVLEKKKDARAAEFKAGRWAEKPGWLVVTCRRSDDTLRQQEDYAACSAAIQNLTLYLWKAGVGSKWTTGDITRDPRFFDIVGIGADEFVVGLLWYGYPKVTPDQSRKPVNEALTELP
jgi:nitroreductase